jgi:asparagine synthase (glutamine-hydrolysing)
MCGIAGFAESSSTHAPLPLDQRRDLIHQMCDVIRHRGPDDEGVLVEEGIHQSVALGMRRLSIIDLSTGHQPIHNEDRTVWIVFNGEIYNFRELRRELEAAGHHFYTSTDTEAIVHAYEQWGASAIGRLRGMFGLAIWDARSRTLLLARDRIGIKPLHYAEVNGRLYFGSEIKSLLCAPDLPRDLDFDALDHYLSFLYTPPEGSIFRHVRKLPPGHLLTWCDGHLTIEQYWQQRVDEPFSGSDADAVAALREVLTDAVRSHLVSDVPLGAFLSGGIDSSLVVALMAETSATRVKTFSIGFDEPAFDELEYARLVAQYFGTDHHELVVKPDALSILDQVVTHFDEPFADPSAIPTWYVSEMARRHVTVALSGDGGDELFGGYERFAAGLAAERFARLPQPAQSAIQRGLGALPAAALRGRAGSAQRFAGRAAQGLPWAYLAWISYVPEEWRLRLLPNPSRQGHDDYAALWERTAGASTLDRLLALNLESYLLDDLLVKADRMSMAHALEVRSPFLDTRLIELASRLAPSHKVRGLSLKRVLKRAVADLLPPEILKRPKRGFGVPLDRWFRQDLESYTSGMLGTGARVRGHVVPEALDALLAEHASGARNHGHALWTLLTLELFLRRHDW